MASGRSTRPDCPVELLPGSYTAILLFWSVPFAIMVLALACFYGGVLLLSVQGFLAELNHPSSNNGPLFFSLVGMITGVYLLAIIVKALTTVQVPRGVRIPPGSFPQLESLIHECTKQAGIEAPDDFFIVPDANAFAYSSGRFSLHERLNHYVLVGAPLLTTLESSDLAAVLFHEFGHLILRRGLWAVSVHHKIEDFLTRCQRAQIHRQGCALVFTFFPAILVGFFLRAFRWSLAGFSKREELLVDKIAARIMGESEFREALIRSVTTIGSLVARADGERSVVEQINTSFHRRLMAAMPSSDGSAALPGYFGIARNLPLQDTEQWSDRLARAYHELIVKQSGPTDSHPALAERIRKLGGTVESELPFCPSSPARLLTVPPDAELVVSAAFASDLRATFFKEKLAAGSRPLEGMSPESLVEFHCRYNGCPRQGQVELAMTQDELYLSSADSRYRLRWHEIGKVAIYTGGNFNFFMQAARVLGAAFREAPSDRVLRLTLTNGGVIDFPHWHFLDNTLEVEALVGELSNLSRVFGNVTDDSGNPISNASIHLQDEHCGICAIGLTGDDGSYSVTIPASSFPVAISVEAAGFAETHASYNGKKKCKIDFVLRAELPHSGNFATGVMRYSEAKVAEELRSPVKQGNAGALGCLGFVLKLVCAILAYFVPFVIPVVLTLQTRDPFIFGNWLGPCTVVGFCTALMGWRLGNRVAAKYFFTKPDRQR